MLKSGSGKAIGLLILVLLVIGYLVFIHFRAFTPYDEGWFIQAGTRFLHGEVPYRDFQFTYNPGTIYVNFLAFKILGLSIFSSRIAALVNSVVMAGLIFLLAKNLRWKLSILILAVLGFIFWGPGQINFVWPVMFCLTSGFAACLAVFSAFGSEKKHQWVFLAGILSAVTFLFKQNFGVAIFLNFVAAFLLIKELRNWKIVGFHLAGYGLILGLQLLYFARTNSWGAYLADFYNVTIVKIGQEGILNSGLPWEYPGPIVFRIVKLLFYLLPLLIAIYTVFVIRKKNRKLIIFPGLVIFYYLFSIRPTTDLVHLAPLMALGLATVGISENFSSKKVRIKRIGAGIFIFVLFLVVMGGYVSLFRNYYRWNWPLTKQNSYINIPAVRIYTDGVSAKNIQNIYSYFEANSRGEEYILIYNFAPGFYEILNKKNPTKYDYLHQGILTDAVEREVISDVEKNKIKHILVNIDLTGDTTKIGAYIRGNYSLIRRFNEYSIWGRNGISE